MSEPARRIGEPAPSHPTKPHAADVVPLREAVQAPLLREPPFVRLPRPSRRARTGQDDHDDTDLTDDRSTDHQSDQSDHSRDPRDGRPRAAPDRQATNARVARWLVAHVGYDEAAATALVAAHGARKVLDVIYDHVVEWHDYTHGRYGTAGAHRLRASDRWGRQIRNHAGYLQWHLNRA